MAALIKRARGTALVIPPKKPLLPDCRRCKNLEISTCRKGHEHFDAVNCNDFRDAAQPSRRRIELA